jgi:formylglycine-generating enzyme
MRYRGGLSSVLLAFVLGCGDRSALDVFGAPPASSGVASTDSGSSASSSGGSSVAALRCGSASGEGDAPPSCAPGGPGLTNCGASSESCCTSPEVEGGTYYRTYASDTDGGATGEADPATACGFRLDKYLVTVGRFRQFVNAWNGGEGYVPPAGSGKHAYLNGGQGLANSGSAGTFEPGWVASDDGSIAPTSTNLACDSIASTWTPSAGNNENLPINCVNWYEAYAFCIWDGGFLPSEAEWEYAAAGGSQQREYPWGSTDPGTSNQYAIYNCYYPTYSPSVSGDCFGLVDIAPVGTATLGAGRWGQLDLAGELRAWNLDWYAPDAPEDASEANYVEPCADCASLGETTRRVRRGSLFSLPASDLVPANREADFPGDHNVSNGFRCSRSP